ncbi:hypothetical protein [Enterococcus avium]|uniref:hypothetical protein n=1 Tax=Enterococcus avium TaxID=33945 RepID=UPI001F591FFA|nr:hypothetical protein [Enterococcus avium]
MATEGVTNTRYYRALKDWDVNLLAAYNPSLATIKHRNSIKDNAKKIQQDCDLEIDDIEEHLSGLIDFSHIL